ncbi:MAG: HAMP domain-containing histidine kinase [Gammaproteobacteria bacterium]|nr:HAMP domain-containing histidine kinase [Gammaproteobacteria bacterium]MDH3465752.1 HAMP domain-containing histidine kinase [Gammaproteobacteria bacterium]
MRGLVSRLKRSLSNRLLLIFAATSLCIVALIISLLIHGLGAQWRANIHPHLLQYLDYVNADIGDPPSVERATELARRLPINIYIQGNGIDFSSTGLPLDIDDLEFYEDRPWARKKRDRLRKRFDFANGNITFGEHRDRTVLRNEFGDYTVYYELRHRRPKPLRDGVIGWALFGIVAILGLCYLLIRTMLRPVHDIGAAVRRMGQGELNYRVPVRADNDLGELAGSINTMASDIERMLDAKRQLLLGVSHELRSPLTRATVAAELLDESVNQIRIREDLQEMENLITEILETERMNTGHAVINRTPVNLNSLVVSVLKELSADTVTTDINSQLPVVELDEARIRLLIRNLISNAIQHGGESEPAPRVSVSAADAQLKISVSDSGPGIPPEHLFRLTEPFYRVDPSRTRSTGGFGIGLYLCRLIAEAHGGELRISSDPGTGTVVDVLLPC